MFLIKFYVVSSRLELKIVELLIVTHLVQTFQLLDGINHLLAPRTGFIHLLATSQLLLLCMSTISLKGLGDTQFLEFCNTFNKQVNIYV